MLEREHALGAQEQGQQSHLDEEEEEDEGALRFLRLLYTATRGRRPPGRGRREGAGGRGGVRSSPVDEGPAGRGRTGAACARGRRRGNAEARGGEVDEGAPAAGARSTRGRRGPGRSGGGGRRARACSQDRVRSLGGDRGALASGSRTPAAGFWPLGYMGWAEK